MAPEPANGPPDVREREAALRAALTQTRIALVLAALLLAGVVALGLFLYFDSERLLRAEEQRIFQETRKQITAHSDVLFREASGLVEEALPPLADAFRERLEEDFPTYVRRVERQADRLGNDLKAHVQRQVKGRYRWELVRGALLLREEFPQVTDPKEREQMLQRLQQALHRVAERYYADEFQKQFDRLARTWNSIPPAAVKGGDREVLEQLGVGALDWLWQELASRPAAPAGRQGAEPDGAGRAAGGRHEEKGS